MSHQVTWKSHSGKQTHPSLNRTWGKVWQTAKPVQQPSAALDFSLRRQNTKASFAAFQPVCHTTLGGAFNSCSLCSLCSSPIGGHPVLLRALQSLSYKIADLAQVPLPTFNFKPGGAIPILQSCVIGSVHKLHKLQLSKASSDA
jgi:hypothetical protein